MSKNGKEVFQLTEERTEEAKIERKKHQELYGKDYCSRRGKSLVPRIDGAANCVTASQSKEQILAEVLTVAYSKSTRDTHIDHRAKINDEANTLSCGDGCRAQSSANYIAYEKETKIRLRKLTPLESERLMCWGDFHTKFGRDENNEIVEMSDVKRYKMCGNGIVSTIPKKILESLVLPEWTLPRKIKIFNTFSGVDGSCLALDKDKFETVAFCEIDKYASMVLRYHYPDIPNFGDITKVNEKEVPDHDLMFISCPCQSFSISGKRAGFEDTRGTLFYETARILNYKKPKYALFENVKGLLNHDGGKTFLTMLQVYSSLGYSLDFEILNARDFGSAQNRERIFMLLKYQEKQEIKNFLF